MAKYINNKIKSGRMAGSVFAVRYGEVIERAYNPYVSNPKSAAQVQVRAKLKLMSQLSAVMGSVIAMPREGAQSARNLFVSANFPNAMFAEDTATINLASVKLTKGVVSLPTVTGSATTSSLSVALSQAVEDIDKVVYAVFRKENDNTLRLIRSSVISAPGVDGVFPYAPSVTGGGNFLVLAYGIRENTERARASFGNMQVLAAETVAKLIATRVLTSEDVTLTETQGVEFASA